MTLTIRRYTPTDAEAVTAMLMPVFRAGDTYTVDPDIAPDAALAYWTGAERRVYVACRDNAVLGTYYLVRNQKGGGGHVCNAGFVTAKAAQGQGIARAMLDHALNEARRLDYAAMQFNFVVATNTRAIATWARAGFETVGRLPRAFRHPTEGEVDALVMMKDLRSP